MAEKSLKIKIGEEYKAKVETAEEFEKSMFKDVYDKAFDCIETILADSSKEESYEKYNNIVAFVGERGTGKTSAMLSVSGALKNEYSSQYDQISYKSLKDKNLKHKTFYDIGVIDPSHFDENSNILEIILAKLFKNFKMQIEESKNRETDHDKKRNLIKAFEEVFENLKTIQNPKDLYKGEALDALLKMSASTDLKGNMTNLVKEYLNFFNNSDNAILLLEIDDIDLSTKHAYEMVEQVRKYLIIPNVVILMAVKMQQLSHIVERNTREEFKAMLDKAHMNDEEPKNMAEKYLEKLIPLERRLFLPTLEGINLDIELIIQDKDNKEYQIGKDDNKEIKNIIRYLIFKRTGNMFFNTDTQVSYIIPRTLRELINLVSKLIAMENNDEEEVKDKTKITLSDLNSDQKNKNYESFKEYFLNYWVESTLKSNHVEIIREVIKRDIKERNKYIVRALNQEYSEKFEEIKTIDKKRTEVNLEGEYLKIVEFANKPTNISLGDLLLVLDLINRLIVDSEDKKFIFAIKTTYSIMLYGLIREIKCFTKFISMKSEKIKEKLAGQDEKEVSKIIEEELSKEMGIRKNKINGYKSLLGTSICNEKLEGSKRIIVKKSKKSRYKEFLTDILNKSLNDNVKNIDEDTVINEDFIRIMKIFATTIGKVEGDRRIEEWEFWDIKSPKDNFTIDLFGIFYTSLERSNLFLYLGNLEFFERLHEKLNYKEKSIVDFLRKIMERFKQIIEKEFLNFSFDIENDDLFKEITIFLKKMKAEKYKNNMIKYLNNFNKYSDMKKIREAINLITNNPKKLSTLIKKIEEIIQKSEISKTNKKKISEKIKWTITTGDPVITTTEIQNKKQEVDDLIQDIIKTDYMEEN